MTWLTPQMREAIRRSLQLAAGAGALAFLTIYYKSGGDVAASASAAAAAAVAALFGRGGVEGLYDSRRAATGSVQPSDVTATTPTQ